jgi:diphthamide biosynthesis methyltransferase
MTERPGDMFYIIGLGLSDEKDITLRGLEVNNVRAGSFQDQS